ncbi:MAG: PepSY domain-containing protein [Planctomycetota bacterium]
MSLAKWSRKAHRVGALVSALPVLVVIVSGLLLQLKKEWSWVQPPTKRGAEARLAASWEDILTSVRSVAAAEVASYADIARIDAQPKRGLLKVQCTNGYEVQLDGVSAEVLAVAYRRSDVIEALHDGSWFHDRAKLWLFLPSALILLGLWVTGVHLWLVPHLVRRRRRKVV